MNILIVTYDWPPRNSIATHRPYSWAKYWSKEGGANVTVLTAKKKFFDQPLDLNLPELENVRVIESDYKSLVSAPTGSKSELIDFLKKIKRIVSGFIGWEYDVRSAWAGSVQEMIQNLGLDFDLIVSTYGPDSAHCIASAFKSANPRMFWVADYRDLWSLNSRRNDSKFFSPITKRKESKVVADANLFTTVSDELATQLASLVGSMPLVVYNGFDIDLSPDNYTVKHQGRKCSVSVVYTGRIYSGKRNPALLAQAIENLISKGLIEKGQIAIDFFGVNTKIIDEDMPALKYTGVINHHGHVTRDAALSKQKNSDFLLLLESPDPESKGFLTGKIFEYIGAGKPIISLGSSHDSAIGRVLLETGCGNCYEDRLDDLEADLLRMLDGVSPYWFKPDLGAIEKYTRRYQANSMLDSIRSRMLS